MFPRWKNPRSGARALTQLLLTLAFVFAAQQRAEAAGTFIPAAGRVDMVHDSARDIVYITSGASVLRYQLGTNSFLSPFNLGGSLSGLDLSPDGNTLVVADRTRTEANLWVHVVDLRTGASSKALTAREFMEGGTFTVVYGSDNQVLVTSTFEGSGWVPLRRFNPATGVWTKLNNLLAADGGTLSQDTMLAASGDRSVIGFAEANISDGRWGSYNVLNVTLAHRTWYENGTSWFNYEIGVNKNGTQYAIPTYGGTFIYNSNFVKVATLGQYAGAQPIGVVYHPVEDVVYFPWTTTTEVRAFNTNTFAQTAVYNFEDTFKHNGNWAFQQGRMKMSRDGSLLFASVTGGVRFVRLYAPLAAEDRSITTDENTPVSVTLSGSVGNGGALSYRVVTQPAHGTLSGTGANLVYTPETNYEGDDSFTFKSVYGPAESVAATVSVSVAGSNDAPSADQQSVTVDEDGSVAVTLTGSDPEGSVVTYAVASGPASGTLTGMAPNLVYTPAPNYNGPDSFTFTVSDGAADSALATVNISVTPVNDTPLPNGQSFTIDEDTSIPVTLSGTDPDGDALTYGVVSAPAHGTLTGTAPNLVYTPASDFYGYDNFAFTVSDGKSAPSTERVYITLNAVNDAPTAAPQTVAANEDAVSAVTLTGSDVDGDALTYMLISVPQHGSLTGTVPNLVYTPAADYNGPDSFIFVVFDGKAQSGMATVSINVASVNDAPVAVADTASVVRNSSPVSLAVLANDRDVDGDALTITFVAQPANGSVSVAPGGKSVFYTPRKNYRGNDLFSYTVGDGRGGTATAAVTVVVK